MSLVRLSLTEDALTGASSEVLVFIIRQLESEGARLQAALDDSEARLRSLETKYEGMLDQSFNDMYDMRRRVEAEEMRSRAATEDLEQVKTSNNQLEADNEKLRLEIDMLKACLYKQDWIGR